MKISFRLLLVFGFLCFSQLSLCAQPGSTRDIVIKQFEQKQVDGLRVTILKTESNNQWSPVSPDDKFHTNDEIKVDLQSNFGGYVYFVNLGSSGKHRLLFPSNGESAYVRAQTSYRLPRCYRLTFDSSSGIETFLVFISPQPITLLGKADKNPDEVLDQDTSDFVAQLRHGTPNSPGIKSLGAPETQNNQTPMVTARDPVWDTRRKNTTVTVSPSKGKTTKLRRNEILGVSIQLVNEGDPK